MEVSRGAPRALHAACRASARCHARAHTPGPARPSPPCASASSPRVGRASPLCLAPRIARGASLLRAHAPRGARPQPRLAAGYLLRMHGCQRPHTRGTAHPSVPCTRATHAARLGLPCARAILAS
ncbi:hypothetical protein OWV82_026578 [Melia azedarach]|nr:hypothetical protein OWV82_026578 [Melia azedarach]